MSECPKKIDDFYKNPSKFLHGCPDEPMTSQDEVAFNQAIACDADCPGPHRGIRNVQLGPVTVEVPTLFKTECGRIALDAPSSEAAQRA